MAKTSKAENTQKKEPIVEETVAEIPNVEIPVEESVAVELPEPTIVDSVPTVEDEELISLKNELESNQKLIKELYNEINTLKNNLENINQNVEVNTALYPTRKFKKGDVVFDNTLPNKIYFILEYYGLHWSGMNVYRLIGKDDDEIIFSFEKDLIKK